MANAKVERQYDSQTDEIPLPPGMDAHWFAREGINVLLNGGVNHAEQLFKKFRTCSPLLSAGASLVDFITAAMTFEEEKMSQALSSLKSTIKMCQVDSLYEGVLTKKPSEKWTPVERIERMIIWADCELFLAFLMFLKQSVVDFVKAGYHMRRSWKMYEKCHREIHGVDPEVSNKKNKKSSRTPSPVELSDSDKVTLNASLCFGYGLIQVAFSIVPTALLKVCEVFGFQANRDIGLDALKMSSNSSDMKAPIARLTLLWYHTVVRPFCALDGNNIEKGLMDASVILDASEKEFPTSAIFLYFKALICRLRGQLEEALIILDKTMETSKEQREIALLCYYDKGWCHLMRMEFESAAPCFSKLREQSRWSEAYYTYLLAVTEGSLGRSGVAYEYLKSVPKLVVRKTQLENFLNRKATLYKKKEPTRIEYVLLGMELLYLWNALPQCSHQTVKTMLKEVESCSTPSMQPLKLLIMGSLYQALGEKDTSMQYFQIASTKPDGKPVDAHVAPYALYEIGIIHSSNMDELDKSKEMLYKAKDGFSGYDFENRLNFRIHAALNNLEDIEEELENQAKLAPPVVDGL